MPVKDKKLKKSHSDKRVSIDVVHSNIIKDIDNYNECKLLLEKEKYKLPTDDKIIHENIIILEHKLNSLKITDENQYFLDNGLLLNDYYNDTSVSINNKSDNNGIMDYFVKTEVIEDETDYTNLITDYFSKIDDEYVIPDVSNKKGNMDKCKLCSNLMKLKLLDSEIYCESCGYTEDILISTDKTSFKDVPREISYFAYKRINHFNEWLAQIQAKETTDIPHNVYKDVMDELKKQSYININNLSYKKVREILKNLNYNKYYENIPHIINVISGKKAPILMNGCEETLRNMFKEIQIPFINHCPETRKNFLSYSYVLHKFCELLELDNLLQYFPLLKSRDKLKEQDGIWKFICKDLEWQYIPSV